MVLRPLGLLERAELRKLATDCGFDVATEEVAWIRASSTQAPLVAWLGRTGEIPVVGLSMSSVRTALEPMLGKEVAIEQPLAGAAFWLQFPDIAATDAALSRAWKLSRALPNELERQFARRMQGLSATERDATVKQRVGQDLFREGLMVLWQGRCAISGLDEPALLRASHAIPWAVASDAERLDVFNGLLLAAHLDAAFDAGFLTVDEAGQVHISSQLSAHSARLLTFPKVVVRLRPEHGRYMDWHRMNKFRR